MWKLNGLGEDNESNGEFIPEAYPSRGFGLRDLGQGPKDLAEVLKLVELPSLEHVSLLDAELCLTGAEK